MLTLEEPMTETHCCEDRAIKKQATPDAPYHYVGSGIRNVYLVGITYYVCPACQKHAAEIPAVNQLHSALARALVRKPSPLSGLEVRFLRKRLGKKAIDFASIVSLTPEYLSHIENSSDPIDPSRDKLVRLIYRHLSADKELAMLLAQPADFQTWITSIQKSCRGETLTATLKRNKQWKVEAAAA